MKNRYKSILSKYYLLPLVVFLTTVAGQQGYAQQDTCVTASCHAALGKAKVVHPPLKDGCATCHQATQEPAGKTTRHPGNLTITLTQPGADLCTMCHEAKNNKKVVHAPIMGGDCTSCHDPHQSPNKAMLKEVMPKLCFQCHAESMVKHKVMHPPVAAGDCSGCHDNHQSDFPKRLLRDERELCLQCHPAVEKNLQAAKVAHPAVQMACTSCHNPHGSANKAMAKASDASLCTACHEPKNKKKVVHAPILGGDCLSCHHPHQSPNKGMLRQAMPKLCFQCHPESMVKHSVMHPPVEAGDCSGCHDNHQSDFPGRLVQEGNGLCFPCHPDKEDGLKTRKVRHVPVRQSCVQCHSPHGSAFKAMLSASVPALCSNCHPNEASLTDKAMTKHGPMTDEKSCMNCHDAHFSDTARLLLSAEMDLCLKCHDKQLDTEQGRIMDMKSFFEANKNGHGPVKDKSCVACHNPHGSDYWRILLKYFPAEMYTSYSDGKYGVCFACHDASAFAELKTEKATQFRNGRKNLHFLHVNKPVKGRSCRSCHEVHADAGTQHHVKERIPFGDWSMPMNFSPNKHGGSCLPGCHGEKTYTR